jgi:sugar lactone lactonase YvrE
VGPARLGGSWELDYQAGPGRALALPADAGQLDGTLGTIRTFAGALSPEGVAATDAALNRPGKVAVDAAGNLFIADTFNHRVREVSASGVITTVAGTGSPGYSGDGGAATSARLNGPDGVAVDADGDLFIADHDNQRVREVSASGVITTVAGTGTYGYSGDGGAATSARLSYPSGVAVDAAGNLFIADSYNYRVRKVSASGVITTVAGNGIYGYSGDGGAATAAQLYLPQGLAVDAADNLFIADYRNQRVRKVSAGGVITTVAGTGTSGYSGDGGAATSARLYDPEGVAVGAAGTLFIADTDNHRVREVSASGVITTAAGTGTPGYSGDGGDATSARLNGPTGVAVGANGDLFIADFYNYRVRKVSASGAITTVAGNGTAGYFTGYGGDGGAATSALLYYPAGVAVDAAGNLFIADTANQRVRKVSASGVISTVAGNGTPGYSGDGGPATAAQLAGPSGVAVDGAGNLFIADNGNERVRKVSATGVITTVAGNGTPGYSGDGGAATSARLSRPLGVAVDAAGNLFIADSSNNRVRKVSVSGVITTVAGTGTSGYSGDGGPATSAWLSYPSGVAVDAAGDLFIADSSNNGVRRVSASGVITTVAGNGRYGYSGDGGPATSAQLYFPQGVAVGAAGDLFIADSYNDRVRKVSAGGVITTVAGTGSYGYSGDGGPATSAQLYRPEGVAVGAAGSLFVADNGNSCVRKVSVVTALQLSAPAAVTAGVAFSVTVTAVDEDGAADPEYAGTVTLSSTDPQFPADLTHAFSPADAGSFTFSGVQLFTAGPQALSAADGALSGGADLAVLAGAAAYLLLAGPPEAQAGAPLAVTVTAYDAYGNVAAGYTGTVTFSSDDPAALLPDDYAFTEGDAGSHAFSVTLGTPGPVLLTVTDADDGTLTGSLRLTVG